MCFDNNNCSCLWLIVILLLVFSCCGMDNGCGCNGCNGCNGSQHGGCGCGDSCCSC